MTLYIILFFIALCIGMAVSVYAFGTGGKRQRIFRDIYFSVEDVNGIGVIYTKTGEYSAVLKMENPVQKYCADIDSYYEFARLFTALAQTLGEGYALHKQDIFIRRQFADDAGGSREFLSSAYFRYFNGRNYTDSVCYLTITQECRKGRLFSYDSRKWREFLVKIRKVHDQMHDAGVSARFLSKREASEYVDRFFAMNFKDKVVSMSNFKVDEETVSMGDRRCKVYSLVDVDSVSLPSLIRPYTNIEVNNTDMPVDLLSAIDNIPGAETVVYNQMIFLPNQKRELALLDKKKNRHASIPNPSNQMAVEDIKRVQEVIARESKQLVYTHYNLVVAVSADTDIQKCTNHLENAFSRMGIHISKRAYNQLEMFVNSFPGNCYGMNPDYDRFLTLGDAATCLMYKERIQHSEDTPLKIYYTDRQGVPVAIDITGKEGRHKLTDNSNFFCLGPSGSGKSFHMNSVVRQLHEQGTDVVMVDTGNSYEGLCEYLGGKYISYTEERPITMNPFRINREELNVEKTGFLKNLVLLIWKGSQGTVTKTEDRLIEQVITEYYDTYFNGFEGFTPPQREDLRKSLLIDDRNRSVQQEESEAERAERIERTIDEIERRRIELKVEELSFNSFYEFSVQRIPDICSENSISGIDISTYPLLGPFQTSLKNKAMEQLEGMIGTLRVYTSRLATKESYWIFHKDGDDFDLKVSDPKSPSYLLIANDPEMESIIGALNALILNRLVTRVNTGQGKNIPVSIIVDELPTLYFHKIDRLIGTARSNKVSVTLGFQELPQLEADYGKVGMQKIITTVGNVVSGSARAKETLEWLSSDIFGKVVQLKKGVTIDRDKTSINLNENMDSLVPASKISDMPTGWICGQTARDFVQTKVGVGGSMKIQESDEFKTSKFFCKTDFNMTEIKKEESEYVPLPKFYTFKSRDERERILYKNFVQVGQDVKAMIVDINNKKNAI